MDTVDVSAKYLQLALAIAKKTALTSTAWPIDATGDRVLEDVTIMWPPGTNGLVGVRLRYNGVAMLPWNQATSFVRDNGRERTFEMGLFISHPLVVDLTNDDTFPHTIYLTAKLRELPQGAQLTPYTPPLIVQA